MAQKGITLIDLTGSGLSCEQIVAAATGTESVRLADAGLERLRRSHEFADRIAGQRPVYGRSTGVGANRTVEVADPAAHALSLLRSHATAGGALRSPERIRAMLVVRLNQLAAGGSGASPAVAEGVAEMLMADTLPPVRELGSIGTGDLSALATTALALLGEIPTSRAGRAVAPISFGAHDALPFISSNAGVIGDAALAWSELDMLSRAYPVVAALTFAAVRGNAEAYSAAVERATPFLGAVKVMRWMRLLTDGAVAVPARIQDPFGLRAIPQAHGPALDAIGTLSEVIELLANAPTENPVLLPDLDGGSIAHHAGFHAAYLGQALDGAAISIAQTAQLVLARLATLTEPNFTGLPPFLGDGTAGASGIMVLEYVAAGALGEIRAAAIPVGLQTVVISRGVEEDASFASLAARQLGEAAGRLRTLVACELVAAVRAVRLGSGSGIGAASGMVGEILQLCAELPVAMADRDLTDDISMAETLLPRLAALLP